MIFIIQISKQQTGKRLYDLLGVPETADKSQIKKAYFKLAQKYNPNIPENKEMFQKINDAYETLKDDEKRSEYDKYGDDYLDHPEKYQGGMFDGMGGFGSVFDMFTGGMGQKRNRGPRKAKPIGQAVEVTLEQMYNGDDIKVNVTRQAKCPTCNGEGSSLPGNICTCSKCGGQGVVMIQRRMGNMIMQQQAQCPDCNGQGETVKDKSKICKQCKGRHIVTEIKEITVHLDPGTPDGYQQVVYGEGNYEIGAEQGDFIVEFRQKEHKIFKRDQADLFMEKKISFIEALCGTSFTLKHLNGDEIIIFRAPGEIINNGQTLCVKNMGLPVKGRIYEQGNLFIKFDVNLPSKITPEQKQQLISILATQEQKERIEQCDKLTPDGVKICQLCYVNPQHRTKADTTTEGQSEYGEGNQGGEQVQSCQAM